MLAIGVRNGHEVSKIGGAEDASDRRCRGNHFVRPLTGFSYPVRKEVVRWTALLNYLYASCATAPALVPLMFSSMRWSKTNCTDTRVAGKREAAMLALTYSIKRAPLDRPATVSEGQ
jgi:hypothetical protein